MAPRTDMMNLWFNLENKWSKKITTYCILCLSLGQAGQSNPLQNSEWRPSTWSQCYHILYIQSGNLSANNHKNKPLLEPVLTGDLGFLYHPKWPPSLLPNSSFSWTLPPPTHVSSSSVKTTPHNAEKALKVWWKEGTQHHHCYLLKSRQHTSHVSFEGFRAVSNV